MNLFKWMGLISTIALALPILFILLLKLPRYRSFPALLAFYILFFINNIFILGYLNIGNTNFSMLVETPLILLFLTYFSKTSAFRKRLLITVAGFACFELLTLGFYGFSERGLMTIKGPGILLVLFFTLSFFIHQVKITVVYHKAAGKALMVASLLFAYVGYGYVYVVNTLINTPFKEDAHLIYFLVTIFSSLTMAGGLIFEQKRVRQLEELKITRKELKAIYGGEKEKTATSFEAIVFNYDKKQWN